MSVSEDAMIPVQSVFWTALWAGMASPVYVYAPVNTYTPYGIPGSVGDSFAIVGWQLSGALSVACDEQGNGPGRVRAAT